MSFSDYNAHGRSWVRMKFLSHAAPQWYELCLIEQYRISIYPAWWLVILTHRVRGSWTSMCGPTQQAGTRTCHLGNKLVLPNVLPRKHVNQPYNMFKICT